MLGIAAIAVLLQIVPLPERVVNTLSPAERGTWQRLVLQVPSSIPLTINPRSTKWALLIVGLTVITFIASHRLLHSSGVRLFIRGLSAIGILVSAVGLAQDASAKGLMYWTRAPLQEGAPPFGPFVDRNSFATWVLLAIPLCVGYLVAHTTVHHKRPAGTPSWRARLRETLDGRAIWLITSISLMAIALVATLSRSGMTSLAVSIVLGGYLYTRGRPRAGGISTWILALCAAGLVLAIAKIDPILVGKRFAATRTSAASRFVIWRETMPVIRDFWLTGTGGGTYETAMLVYQRSSPGVRFNQAHNHYLQVAAEGGTLIALPAILAVGLFVAGAVRKLRADVSGMYWIRAGAVCGLAGVAAQSVWDTGLTAPANAFLAAIAAAIVVHRHEVRPESHA
jgi:putative inorganic carbon (hco3(-)) transporter